MAIATVSPGVWDVITTTTEDTAFQNRGGSVMFLTTEDTTGLALSNGIAVPPGQVVVVTTGKEVSAAFPQGSGSVFYVGI